MQRRAWHIGEIFSVVSEYVVAPRGVDAAHLLADHLARRTLLTADRVVYDGALRHALLAQFPDLRAYLDDFPIPEELQSEWLRRRVAEFGEYHPVKPLEADHPACTKPIWSDTDVA
jgi:hypothetical protein